MADIQVNIVTPTRLAWSGRATEVRVSAWEGEMGILPDHDIVLALLRGGLTTVISGGQSQRFVTGRGFVEVGPNLVTVLADSCVAAEDVDRAKAAADLEAADKALAVAVFDTPEHDQATEKREIARAAAGL